MTFINIQPPSSQFFENFPQRNIEKLGSSIFYWVCEPYPNGIEFSCVYTLKKDILMQALVIV